MAGKWYVMYNNRFVDKQLFSSDTLSDCLKMARAYKAYREMISGRVCHGVCAVKCGGVPMQHSIDGTQAHYV